MLGTSSAQPSSSPGRPKSPRAVSRAPPRLACATIRWAREPEMCAAPWLASGSPSSVLSRTTQRASSVGCAPSVPAPSKVPLTSPPGYWPNFAGSKRSRLSLASKRIGSERRSRPLPVAVPPCASARTLRISTRSPSRTKSAEMRMSSCESVPCSVCLAPAERRSGPASRVDCSVERSERRSKSATWTSNSAPPRPRAPLPAIVPPGPRASRSSCSTADSKSFAAKRVSRLASGMRCLSSGPGLLLRTERIPAKA